MGLVRSWYGPSIYAALSLAFGIGAMAQMPSVPADSFEGQTVTAISFEPAVQPLESHELQSLLPLKVGQPFRIADSRTAIALLFATGRYDDIQIDAQPASGGVSLKLLTSVAWFVGHIEIQGDVSEPPNRGQILSAAGIAPGQPFYGVDITTAEERIRELLVENGYFDPLVSSRIEHEPEFQQVHVTFDLRVGRRAHYLAPIVKPDGLTNIDRIIRKTGWQRFLMPGFRGITQARTRTGVDNIRQLYQKEDRLLATVVFAGIEPVRHGKLTDGTPHIAITPGPIVKLQASGAKISRGELTSRVPIFEEGTVDNDLLAAGAAKIGDYFQERGYIDATVDFKRLGPTESGQDRTVIEYSVQQGTKHRLAALLIKGNRYFDEKTLRERMSIVPRSFSDWKGRFSEALSRRDKAVIEELYRSNGFRDARVTVDTEDDYRNVKGDLAVTFAIDEGHQYLVSSLTISGAEKVDLTSIAERLASQKGQPFSESDIAADHDTILKTYGAAGYTSSTVEWSATPGVEPFTFDVKFVIHEGTAQFVRAVLVTGLSVTKASVAGKQVDQKQGDPLSPDAMAATQRKLYDLGIFSQVNVGVQNPDGAESSRVVLYDVQEASRYSLTAGLGTEFGRIGSGVAAQDLSSPGGGAAFTPRASISLTRSNLFGEGQSASLQLRLSTIQRRSALSYFIPRIFGRAKLDGSFSALYDDTYDVNTFRAIRREVSAQLSERVSRALTVFYRFSLRDVGVSNLKISPYLVPRLAQSVNVAIGSFNLVHDRRDDPIDPHKGLYSTLDVGLATGALGSQVNFGRFLGRNASYYRIGSKLVFARETQFGVEPSFGKSSTTDPADSIPLPERFYGGGGNTMRGVPQNQAGPRDSATGFPLGGSALFFNSTELRFPFYGPNIQGVLFEDLGNVYSSIGSLSLRPTQKNITDFNYTPHAVGFGVRYRTPVGPMRFDLAWSLNPPKYNGFTGDYSQLVQCSASGNCTASNRQISHFQFFFSIGQAF